MTITQKKDKKYLEFILLAIPFLSIGILSNFYQNNNKSFRLLNDSPNIYESHSLDLSFPFNIFSASRDIFQKKINYYVEKILFFHNSRILNISSFLTWNTFYFILMQIYLIVNSVSNCSILLSFCRIMSQSDNMLILLFQNTAFSLIFSKKENKKLQFLTFAICLFFLESYQPLIETFFYIIIALLMFRKYLKRVNELEIVSILVGKAMLHSNSLRWILIAFLLNHELKFGFILRMGWMHSVLFASLDWGWIFLEIHSLKFWLISIYWLVFLFIIFSIMILSNNISQIQPDGKIITKIQITFIKVDKIIFRKFFHIVAFIMFVPIVIIDLEFMVKSFEIALTLFLIIESFRVVETSSPAKFIDKFLRRFTDERDSTDSILILTHIYLLVGCIMPCWIYIHQNQTDIQSLHKLYPYMGLVSLCIGDSAASIFGVYFGKLRLWGIQKNKTLEGTLASIISQFIAFTVITWLIGISISDNLFRLIILSILSGLFEASTEEIDNLVLPLYSCSILELSLLM